MLSNVYSNLRAIEEYLLVLKFIASIVGRVNSHKDWLFLALFNNISAVLKTQLLRDFLCLLSFLQASNEK